LDRVCFDQAEWLNVALSGNNLFATRASANKSYSDVILFNLQVGSSLQLSQSLGVPATGLLAAQGSWVAWDATGGTLLYNLSNHEHTLVNNVNGSGALLYPRIDGAWLYWTDWAVDGYKVVVYSLDRREMYIMAAPGENELVWEPTIYVNMIVWERTLQIDQANGHSLLEWTRLPQ
jgi:hypothetical protein